MNRGTLNLGSKGATENSIKFFGASLDALDIPEALNIKRAYIEALLSERRPVSDVRDPYALFQTIMKDRFLEYGHQYLGRFNVESWLTPKHRVSDLDMVHGEIFYTLKEAQVIIEGWRKEYNTFRPHSSLGYLPPAPEAVLQSTDGDIEPWIINKGIDRMIIQRLT